MKALLNKPWFVVLLALAALVLVGNSLWDGGKTPSQGGVATQDDSAALPGGENTAEEGARLPVKDALKALALPKGSVVRDPFAQRAQEEVAAVAVEKPVAPDLVDTMHLSALWTQNGATYTLINDHIYQAGDRIGRLKIESATQEGVWVTHWKGRDFVALGRDFTLRTPAAATPL